MTREGTSRDSYTGRAGQMAVLAELLSRGINIAVPEVDEGEDVLAFRIDSPVIARIQVKTATAEPLKEEGRYAARFSIPLEQTRSRANVTLLFIFAVRFRDSWSDFILISQEDIDDRLRNASVGYINRKAGELQLYLSFSPQAVRCSGQDWQTFRNAWEHLSGHLRAEARQAE
jgi:hypothetical protein